MLTEQHMRIQTLESESRRLRVYEVSGPITLPNLFTFQDELRRRDPPARVVLDLSHVPYIDSAGLGAIVNYYVHCERGHTQFALTGVNQRIVAMLRTTHLDGVVPIVGSIEE